MVHLATRRGFRAALYGRVTFGAVEALELGRSDIGFGRLVVDERGVTRHRMIRTQHIAWDDITSYHLELELRGITGDAGYIVGGPLTWIADYAAGKRGRHQRRFGMTLVGARTSVFFNWRFERVETAIIAVLARVHDRITARARSELDAHGLVRFGHFRFSRHGIGWRDREPLARTAVEQVELFNSTDVAFRVLRRSRAWPYKQVPLNRIPNVLSALVIAKELGYGAYGWELLRPLLPPRAEV